MRVHVPPSKPGLVPMWYVGGKKWSTERPDALEWGNWYVASSWLAAVKGTSPHGATAKVIEEIKEDA